MHKYLLISLLYTAGSEIKPVKERGLIVSVPKWSSNKILFIFTEKDKHFDEALSLLTLSSISPCGVFIVLTLIHDFLSVLLLDMLEVFHTSFSRWLEKMSVLIVLKPQIDCLK